MDLSLIHIFRLALQPAVLVHDLQRTEQIIAGIIGKGQPVCPVIDKAVLGGKIVIEPVQLRLLLPDVAVRCGSVHLQVDQFLDAIPQPYHCLLYTSRCV